MTLCITSVRHKRGARSSFHYDQRLPVCFQGNIGLPFFSGGRFFGRRFSFRGGFLSGGGFLFGGRFTRGGFLSGSGFLFSGRFARGGFLCGCCFLFGGWFARSGFLTGCRFFSGNGFSGGCLFLCSWHGNLLPKIVSRAGLAASSIYL